MKHKKSIFIISILVIILLLILGFKFCFKLNLKGSEKVVLNYNQKYEEKGYSFKFFNKNLTKTIKINSNLKEGKIGTYKINYSSKIGLINFNKSRTVVIKDDIKPNIELKGNNKINICPGNSYEEEGYIATDEYDGNITDKVKIKKEENKIIYTVEDKSGNQNKIIRELKYIDNEKPKIILKGNSSIYMPLNEEYKEPGYIIKDNCSSNLEKNIKITNNVNNKKTGSYEIKYYVKDKSGNDITAKRTIHIYDSKNNNNNIGGIIYLTFDDGPTGSGSTNKILDILKEEGVKATFFVTGNGPDSLIKREYDEGHTIALHTYTHKFSEIYSSTDNFFNDINKVSERVKRITGKESKALRFAGGTSNTISRHYKKGIMKELLEMTTNKGYKIYDWNVDSNDAGICAKKSTTNKKECVYNNVTRNLSKSRKNYVLMHDIKSYTADALRDIIRYGKSKGFVFERIEETTPSYNFRPNN